MANLLQLLSSGLPSARSISSAIDTLLGASDEATARTALGLKLGWAKLDGASPVGILSSGGDYGPTAISRIGPGIYDLTYPSFGNTDYIVVPVGGNFADGQGLAMTINLSFAFTATQCRINCFSGAGSFQDQNVFWVLLVGE